MKQKYLCICCIIVIILAVQAPAAGVVWDGLTWYYSVSPSSRLFVNAYNQLEWKPEKEGQITARIPDQRLSQVGDKVEFTWLWMTDGAHNCADCFSCNNCYDGSIECIAGTSDMRVGLFQSNGQYITNDGYAVSDSSLWEGYKGYAFRFGPNMIYNAGIYAMPLGSGRWVDCTGEVHKTGAFQKKPASLSNLMFTNDGLNGYIYGFELPPGQFSLFEISIERLSSSSVRCSITLNGRTQTWTDTSSTDQAQKIDVLAIHMRNGRPYSRMVLDKPCDLGPIDLNDDDFVDGLDLQMFSNDWLKGEGSNPDPNRLVIHYAFDETSGSTAYDSTVAAYDGAVQVVSTGIAKTNAWDPAGYDGNGCINFDGNTKVTVSSASTAFAGLSSAASVSLWINGNAAVQPDPASGMAFQAVKTGNDRVLLAHIPATGTAGVMFDSGGLFAQRLFWTGATAADWEGQWNHYVFTVDTVAGTTNIYCNGEKKAWKAATAGVDGITGFMVGNGLLGSTNYEYYGKIDDFRVYSYALSPGEVLSVFNGGILPPDMPTNLYNDNIINFKDFAEFASQWLSVCE